LGGYETMGKRFDTLRKLTPHSISLRLKAYRKQRGIRQEDLAKRLGIKRNTLLRWEGAQVRISNIMLKHLIDEGIL